MLPGLVAISPAGTRYLDLDVVTSRQKAMNIPSFRAVLSSLAMVAMLAFAQAPATASPSDGGSIELRSPARVQLAQTYDHIWNPGLAPPYNPGVIINDTSPRGYWEYQYYFIQTENTNGFIIVYYNLVCAGSGKKCPATSAPASCFLAGGWYGDCDTSIPRNF